MKINFKKVIYWFVVELIVIVLSFYCSAFYYCGMMSCHQ